MVQLEPADLREIVALRIEEQVIEEGRRGLQSRRIARPQPPVDFDNRVFGLFELVLRERQTQRPATRLILGDRALR